MKTIIFSSFNPPFFITWYAWQTSAWKLHTIASTKIGHRIWGWRKSNVICVVGGIFTHKGNGMQQKTCRMFNSSLTVFKQLKYMICRWGICIQIEQNIEKFLVVQIHQLQMQKYLIYHFVVKAIRNSIFLSTTKSYHCTNVPLEQIWKTLRWRWFVLKLSTFCKVLIWDLFEN